MIDKRLIDTMLERAKRAENMDELQDVLTEITAGALFIAHVNGFPVGQIAQRASMMALMVQREGINAG